MTKQEKFLLLVVLLVAGIGTTVYVTNNSKQPVVAEMTKVQPIEQVQSQSGIPAAQATATNQKSNPAGTQTPSGTVVPTAPAINTTKSVTTKVAYQVPEGDTNILGITVTLTNGLISDITFSENPRSRESKRYYSSFVNVSPKSQVVGKAIQDIPNLAIVGGSSLTTQAFNQGIAKL